MANVNIKSVLGATLLASALGAGAAFAQTYPPQTPPPYQTNPPVPGVTPSGKPYYRRGEVHSARNLLHVRQRLETLITELEHDAKDYGGYRASALRDLEQARTDLENAINYDATHGG